MTASIVLLLGVIDEHVIFNFSSQPLQKKFKILLFLTVPYRLLEKELHTQSSLNSRDNDQNHSPISDSSSSAKEKL